MEPAAAEDAAAGAQGSDGLVAPAEAPEPCQAPTAQSTGEIEKAPSDDALVTYAEALEPWNADRFKLRTVLQRCPRNHGEVLLMEDSVSGEPVAVKTMPLSWTGAESSAFRTAHPEETEVPWMDMGVTRWLQDRSFAHSVKVIGRYHDYNGGFLRFVMDYAEGGDLFTYMEASEAPSPGPPREALMWPMVVEFLSAVRQLHAHGIAHRDLSLENVLLSKAKEGPLKLIDFGMATTQRRHIGSVCGKPSYIAPEVHAGAGYDAFQVDAFSCGVVLYTLALADYPWLSTRPGGCKCFEYVRQQGFLAFLQKRRIPVGRSRVPIAQVLSEPLANLISGLLSLDSTTRLTVTGADDDPGSVWSQSWLREAPGPGGPPAPE